MSRAGTLRAAATLVGEGVRAMSRASLRARIDRLLPRASAKAGGR